MSETPDISAEQHRVVVEMLKRSLATQSGWAYPVDKWVGKEKTSIRKSEIRLGKQDGDALVAAGLLEYIGSGTVHYKLTPAGVRLAIDHVDYKPMNVKALMEHMLETLAYFHPVAELDGKVPIPAIYVPGRSRLVLVLGDNAGGKSFFRRLVNLVTHRGRKAGVYERAIPAGPFPVHEFIHLSMQGRTASDFSSTMIYGDESWRSTGENSAHTVTMGVKTGLDRMHTSIVYWDEPDIGMSAACAAGVGRHIRVFVENDAPLIQAVFVTSHSPALVRMLESIRPHYLYLGDADGPPTLEAWFEAQAHPTPISPDDLQKRSHERFQMIQAILNRKKK